MWPLEFKIEEFLGSMVGFIEEMILLKIVILLDFSNKVDPKNEVEFDIRLPMASSLPLISQFHIYPV